MNGSEKRRDQVFIRLRNKQELGDANLRESKRATLSFPFVPISENQRRSVFLAVVLRHLLLPLIDCHESPRQTVRPVIGNMSSSEAREFLTPSGCGIDSFREVCSTVARHKFFIRLRVVFSWTAFIAAGIQIYMTCGIQLLLIGLLWGIGPALGMQNGVRRASAEAWNRKQTRIKSTLGLILLAAIVLFPAIVALYFGEFLTALLLAILIVFGMAAVCNLCNFLFGPIQPPGSGSCADQPQNS